MFAVRRRRTSRPFRTSKRDASPIPGGAIAFESPPKAGVTAAVPNRVLTSPCSASSIVLAGPDVQARHRSHRAERSARPASGRVAPATDRSRARCGVHRGAELSPDADNAEARAGIDDIFNRTKRSLAEQLLRAAFGLCESNGRPKEPILHPVHSENWWNQCLGSTFGRRDTAATALTVAE